jgi:hypothetical protein
MLNNKCKIVGIHGRSGSGKDTIANYIREKYKYEKAGFADPLKWVCAELFLENPAEFFSEEGKREVMPFWGITRRAALQFVGTELVREHLGTMQGLKGGGYNHWIRCMEKRIQEDAISHLVINDLRFQNEADWVYNNDGVLLVVKRPDAPKLESGIPAHSSEASISTQPEKTWLIDNSSTIENLYTQIDKFMNSMLITKGTENG